MVSNFDGLLGVPGLACLALVACGPVSGDFANDGGACDYGDVTRPDDGRVGGGPFASRVVSFSPGEGAGFGAREMPGVVLGPPRGGGEFRGSTDVVSLGLRGEIVLDFEVDMVDGPGPDLVVFENPFVIQGQELRVWAEPAEVAVSLDGQRWQAFPCTPRAQAPHPGCAGQGIVHSAIDNGICALDPRVSGGDLFDLGTLGVARARYVRIRDLGLSGNMAPASGFDLDAVAILHPFARTSP